MNMLDGFDNTANKLLGDGGDPQMAPPGQQTMDPYDILRGMQYTEISEKASAVEALSAAAGQELEMPNKYKVKSPDGKDIFFVVESTGCCARQCKQVAGDCAPWDVDFRVINDDNEAEEAFKLHRPFTCTCCCLNRPTVTITDVASGKDIASLKDPCACCDLTFAIMDEDGDQAMTVEGGCCQMGLCMPLPCGPCAEVHFNVKDSEGHEVGHITKKVPSCLKFLATPDVDNYKVDMQGLNDSYESPKLEAMKIALMAISIFIDFRYFNDNPNDEDADGDHIPDRFDFNDDS